MPDNFDEKLCEEKSRNMHKRIDVLEAKIDKLESKLSFFNLTGVGILVSLLTGLIMNHFGG